MPRVHVHPKLMNYIRDRLAAATPLNEIRKDLRRRGVPDPEITMAIEMGTHGTVAAQYPIPDTPKLPRSQAFGLLLAVLVLVAAAVGLLAYFLLQG
jgi:hypothetical protein